MRSAFKNTNKMSIVKVEDLWVKVTYEVKLGDLEIPKNVYDEIEEASDEGRDIEMNYGRYVNAEDWLSSNIRESDCMEWKCEIIEMISDDSNEADA